MAITRKPDAARITPGKWICRSSMMTDGICSAPRLVTRVAGQRAYFIGREGDEKYCALKTVAFACDSEKEGLELADLEKSQLRALRAVKDEYKKMIDALIDKHRE